MYCAIIGDIIDSRVIETREILQERYKAVFNKINREFNDDIEAYFQIRDGDGFHGLLKKPKNLVEIIMLIKLAIIPHQIRIGIGFGNITTHIDKNDVKNVDGSAFSIARDGMNYISEYKNKYERIYQTTILKFDRNMDLNSNNYQICDIYENLINSVFCACTFIDKKWDRIHADTILEKLKNRTQREIADKLRITQSGVQKRISSSNYYTYEYYNQNIKTAVDGLWEILNG